MVRIDARSKPCPKPVMMTREALEKEGLPLEVIVDSGTALQNVRRFLESRKLSVSVVEEGGTATLICSREGSTSESPAESDAREKPEDLVLVICSPFLGQPDKSLGDVLMKSFLDTMAGMSSPPSAIALMNGGVMLAMPDNSASESLRAMEEKGCRVLVCGTCTKHFGITGSISTGVISNMFEIAEVMTGQARTLVIG
jgi:selenium metabolism protein YedF